MVMTILGVFVVVILVLCALVVVMAALRPSISGSLVRNFTNKGAKSDEEMQEHFKAINWKQGFLRLTLVLSLLLGIFAGIVNVELSIGSFWTGFFISFGMIWFIYFAVGFVIKGFTRKK